MGGEWEDEEEEGENDEQEQDDEEGGGGGERGGKERKERERDRNKEKAHKEALRRHNAGLSAPSGRAMVQLALIEMGAYRREERARGRRRRRRGRDSLGAKEMAKRRAESSNRQLVQDDQLVDWAQIQDVVGKRNKRGNIWRRTPHTPGAETAPQGTDEEGKGQEGEGEGEGGQRGGFGELEEARGLLSKGMGDPRARLPALVAYSFLEAEVLLRSLIAIMEGEEFDCRWLAVGLRTRLLGETEMRTDARLIGRMGIPPGEVIGADSEQQEVIGADNEQQDGVLVGPLAIAVLLVVVLPMSLLL
jgi:hypothetical protein